MKKEAKNLKTLKVQLVKIILTHRIRGGQTNTANIVIEDIIEI